jgi:hypothetical protein
MAVGDIILGDGVFQINGNTIGLTRGGGQFVVEREYRVIDADGDYGPVKGRVRKIRSIPKLTVNALELSASRLTQLYPALSSTSTGTGNLVEATSNISVSDYVEVTWIGQTKDGREVIITLRNAINMDNVDLSMVDKEEIVASVTYTGTYDELDRLSEPWSVEYIN